MATFQKSALVKLRPYVLKVPYVSLVNLNLGRESVREIIQSSLEIGAAEQEPVSYTHLFRAPRYGDNRLFFSP